MARYKEIEIGQGYFLTINPDEHFDENSIERFLDTFIDNEIDLDMFCNHYKNDDTGQKAINPKLKLKVILYSFINGISSSRKIENMIRMNHTGYLFFLRGQSLDHSTICKFIKEFSSEIKIVFSKLLSVMNEMQLIDWSKIMIDGTKISSNASIELTSDKTGFKKKYTRIKKLSDKIVERAKKLEEEKESTNSKKYDEEKIRIERQKKHYNAILRKIEAYEKQVEEKNIDSKKKVNLSDPDSAILNNRKMYLQGYNIQASFSSNDIIVDIETTNSNVDITLTDKKVNDVEQRKNELNVEEKSKYLLDKGYFNTNHIKNLADNNLDLYLGLPQSFTNNKLINGSYKLSKNDEYTVECQYGNKATGKYEKCSDSYRFYFQRLSCNGCNNYNDCWKNIKSSSNVKSIKIIKTYVENFDFWKSYDAKRNSDDGRDTYNKRIGKEHNFDTLKTKCGIGKILRRGLSNCDTEVCLGAIAFNFKKLFKNVNENINRIDQWKLRYNI